MVNLDKWEEVTYADLKIGDKVRRINKHDDGTVLDIRGTIHSERFGVLQSKDNFALVRNTYSFATELYRRKPKPYSLPTELGAIVSGTPAGAVDREWCVFDGEDWCSSVRAYRPSEMFGHFQDLRLEREGITVG
jgi:hypothetical protein